MEKNFICVGKNSFIASLNNSAGVQKATDALCTECGLCCDGSLFSDIELTSPRELSGLEVLGLDVEEDDNTSAGLLLQPCGALKGTRCSIYAHRPKCCRTFECRLLRDVEQGTVTLAAAKQTVRDVSKQIDYVEILIGQLRTSNEHLPLKERAMEALEESENSILNPEIKAKRNDLAHAIVSIEKLIEKTFLAN